MSKRAVAKLDVKFNQDWSKIIDLYNNVNARWQADNMPEGHWVEDYQATRYDFGSACAFIPLDAITEERKVAGALVGKLFDSMLPWADDFKRDLGQFNLSLNFYESIRGLKPHIDGHSPEIMEKGHCRMNYILYDCNAMTYVDNDGVIESYPSIGGNAYLLDTTKLHWVVNNEKRYAFQCVFFHPFEEVAEWFDSHPGLIYGK
jgi:hypothetical protein